MMNLVQMPEKQRLLLRKKCLRSLYCFCKAVMGYDEIVDSLHGAYCSFLSGPDKRKQVTMPRSFVKTWIGSIACPIWTTLPREEEDEFPYEKAWEDKFWQLGPNMRILIASYVISNAEKMISLIRQTYESNVAMQMLFPEVIPVSFSKVRWSNQSACINRSEQFTESTYEAAGIGGASVSRHYDLIIEDDLIYAKKDDFSDQELQPGKEDIDKAIGWHKLCTSLLVPGRHTRIHNTGTRWAKHDLIDYIWDKEPHYKRFIRACVDIKELEAGKPWRECKPSWEESYDIGQLEMIASAQGPFMFATQYLLFPMSPDATIFKPHWLQFYKHRDDVPKTIRKFTTVDVALWEESTRKNKNVCDCVITTCGWCDKHHMWVLHYDIGRFNPSEVIMMMAKHWKIFSPEHIFVEEVYYQKALRHFCREYMEDGKIPYMSVRGVAPEGNRHKDVRIRALEPLASNLGLHCRREHKALISEFNEFVPNSRLCKKDILDTLAYQLQVARPGVAQSLDGKKNRHEFTMGSMDDFLKECWSTKDKGENRFGVNDVEVNPYVDDAEALASTVFNPFYIEDEFS